MLLLRCLPLAVGLAASLAAAEPLPFEIKAEKILREYAAGWQWFHPRPAAIPGMGRNGAPLTILTIQKHLGASDHFSGMSIMSSDDLGRTWKGPVEIPELRWAKESETVDIAVADITPGWHRASGKVLAVGAQVRYDKKGTQLEDRKQRLLGYVEGDKRENGSPAARSLDGSSR
ncbi:MAG: hypothetical protein ACKV22_20170 [Bryobacteraceae bacterium]